MGCKTRRLFTFLMVCCQLFFLAQIVTGQLLSRQKDDLTTTPSSNSTISPISPCQSDYTCQQCVAIPQCYFCNSNGTGYGGCQVYPASHVFPRNSQCPLSDARWGVCWVNFEALIIGMSIVAGLLILSIGCGIYCCCCKRKSGGNDLHELKWERETSERQQRHADRRAEREAKMNVIRQKYGLNQDTASYSRMEDE